ncbi:hypothetical protein [uncultured Methanoregula sp.]|uniref:hypothetical protein n=1 Tax=uncultured Methanoregula sp. TaxID=1005933 RepID=UPI002AAAE388|nr:hypothetical protein [uncultured Methanoregula sp.]
MRRMCLVLLTCALLGICFPVSGAVNLTIAASDYNPHIGDTITLNGTVSGINTIAVYLFLSGPGLDPRGTTLDNLNIPTGRGLFTTAPVHMNDGTWSYKWDTSVILGTLRPGNYTVNVVIHPIDGLHYTRGEYVSTTIAFQPPEVPIAETPVSPVLPVAALAIAAILFCAARLNRK